MLQRTAVLHLILYLGIKGGDVRRDEVHWCRLRGWEKAKWGRESLWDWMKSKRERHMLLHCGYKIGNNMYSIRDGIGGTR